tara:strand:+ start:161 stop:322 length:162 start_codon:yes stop_codon:yes gene_type:complete
MKTPRKKKTLKELSEEVNDLKHLFNQLLRYFDSYMIWKGDHTKFTKHVEHTYE